MILVVLIPSLLDYIIVRQLDRVLLFLPPLLYDLRRLVSARVIDSESVAAVSVEQSLDSKTIGSSFCLF